MLYTSWDTLIPCGTESVALFLGGLLNSATKEPVVVLEGGVRMPKLEKTSFSDRQLLTDAETLVV